MKRNKNIIWLSIISYTHSQLHLKYNRYRINNIIKVNKVTKLINWLSTFDLLISHAQREAKDMPPHYNLFSENGFHCDSIIFLIIDMTLI